MSGNTISEHHALDNTLMAICARCGHQRTLDLPALLAAGLGARGVASLRFVCSASVPVKNSPEVERCGGRRVQFVIGSARADRPSG